MNLVSAGGRREGRPNRTRDKKIEAIARECVCRGEKACEIDVPFETLFPFVSGRPFGLVPLSALVSTQRWSPVVHASTAVHAPKLKGSPGNRPASQSGAGINVACPEIQKMAFILCDVPCLVRLLNSIINRPYVSIFQHSRERWPRPSALLRSQECPRRLGKLARFTARSQGRRSYYGSPLASARLAEMRSA